ncbi:MAG: Fur family transcriptional regulator [Anaerolineales bacterium]|jgi:Fe2+ or Zn2+ uptake regulation protein
MTCGNQYTTQLRASGYRMTPQRMAILHVLHHADKHLSPTEVYQRASHDVPGLTEPTVYRTLEFLAENGLVCSAQAGGGHLAYEIAKADHHHLICRKCGGEVQIDHTSLEQLYSELEAQSGFRFIDSHITFFGLCPECQKLRSGG